MGKEGERAAQQNSAFEEYKKIFVVQNAQKSVTISNVFVNFNII